MDLEKNDLVELEYNSIDLNLAKIISVGKNTSEALNLLNGEKIILQNSELYLKEHITDSLMSPYHENQMKMLGAKNVWVKLTRREYNKILKIKKQINSESVKEIDEKQIEKLKKWFMENKEDNQENKEKIINIFGDVKEEKEQSPLSRFIKRNML